MNTKHLTDDELQQYALNSADDNSTIAEHLHFCEDCKSAVETYRLLFTSISEQEVPAFEFDVSELVVMQLQPQSKTKLLPEDFFIYLFSFAMIVITGVMLYFFRRYMIELFSGAGNFVVYLTVSSVTVLLVFLCIDQYKTYQQKMKAIDFY
ncbi:hypothetical protein WG954_05410 [Lacibacter sp. H375]|uniref:hypothetical protein n=1 Tax=Lacibacter sp. H375 TaxID=3133424 RepID=UPI0030BAA7F9